MSEDDDLEVLGAARPYRETGQGAEESVEDAKHGAPGRRVFSLVNGRDRVSGTHKGLAHTLWRRGRRGILWESLLARLRPWEVARLEAQRLRRFVPGDLNESQQRVHDAITGGSRAVGPSDFSLVNDDGSLAGPFNALVAAGDLGFAIQSVGEAIRFHGTLSAKARELAILLVARTWRAEFEWYAHEAVARRVGVTDEVIEAVLAGEPPDLDDPKMQAAHDVTEEVLSTRTLSDSTFAVAHAALGEAQLLELVALIGYYGLLAGFLNGFAVGIPDSATPRFR